MRKVIVNSTPLIVMANAGCLHLLKDLYGRIMIPGAVYDEVTAKEDSACQQIASGQEWIEVVPVIAEGDPMLAAKLHPGEIEVILLAEGMKADLAILDDAAARNAAKFRGITVTGTLGVLLRAKDKGLISSVKPLMNQIRSNGLYVSSEVYQDVLWLAKEKNED